MAALEPRWATKNEVIRRLEAEWRVIADLPASRAAAATQPVLGSVETSYRGTRRVPTSAPPLRNRDWPCQTVR